MEHYRAVHIPCTLKGPGNYITWSRMTRAALGGRGLWEHVTSSSAPKQITQGEDGKEIVVVDEGKWGQEDLMVLSILHSSLDGPLMDTYSHCTTPKQLWDTLQRVYGNTSNLTRIYEVKRAINTLQQEDGDFTKHLGKYSQLWSELEMLRPSSNDPETLEARREQDKVFGLFFTLSPSFNDVVRHILREKELPSYDEVCAQLQKEIGSDGLFGGGKGDLSMAHKAEKVENAAANKAYFKPRGGGDKSVTCEHCKYKGHSKTNCWILHPHLRPVSANKYNQARAQEARAQEQPTSSSMRLGNDGRALISTTHTVKAKMDSNNNNNRTLSIPVTLKGVNYLLWARMVKIALGGKGLWSHVSTETAPKQTIQGEDGKEMVVADEGKWGQEDLMVLTALLSSLEPAIMESYSYCETTKQLWDTLYKVYGNVSNLTRVFEVKRAINALSQGDEEFQPHFGKYRSLWAELELLRPHTTDPATLLTRREEDKVFGLLLTLNPSYGSLIKHILRADKLPDLDEVCAQIQKEEGSVGLFGSKGDLTMAHQAEEAVANKAAYKQDEKKVLICEHCKKKGHMKDKCWILHPHLKPNKFKEPRFQDARAHLSTDGNEPVTPSSVCSNNNGGGSAMASTSSTAPKQITQGEDGKEIVVVDEDKWGQEDLMVLSILHSSLDGPLMDTYSHCTTPKQLWDTLQRVYGNTSNLTRIYEVKRAINTLQQEEGDFTKHLGKYSQLWSELEMLRPSSNDPETLEARREQDKIFGLLFTLSPNFNDVVRHILREKELPSYDEVCAQLQKEIGSDGLFGGGKGDLSMAHKVEKVESASANKAHFKPRGGGDKSVTCEHCKYKGHSKTNCWILHPHLRPASANKYNQTRAHEARAQEHPAPSYMRMGNDGRALTSTTHTGDKRKPAMEMESRIFIPVTLEGSNYLVWSRLARVTLGGHGLWDSHIMKAEASKRMTQEDSQASGLKNEDKWVQEDMLTLEIIQSSLSVSILEAYSHCESAKELWESLQKVYGNASNLSQVFKVKQLINNLSQDEMEFNQFFGKFSSLWAELDVLRPSSVDPEVLRERQEQDRVFSLLLALNPSYNSLIKHILRGERLPSLEDVCCWIQREHCAHSLFKEERKVVPPVRNMLDQKRHNKKLRKALKVKKRQVYEKIKSSMTALTKVVEQEAVNGLSMYSALTTESNEGGSWNHAMIKDGPIKVSDIEPLIKAAKAIISAHFKANVKVLRSDNGGEYTSHAFKNHLAKHGIVHQTSCPYTPQQNGVAERKNRHLMEVARSMMFHANVPKRFWSDAVVTACYLINRIPTKVLRDISPYEVLNKTRPSIQHLRVFGCTCFVLIPGEQRNKLEAKSMKCMFIGYSPTQKGYKCYNTETRRVIVSRDVKLMEGKGFYAEKNWEELKDLSQASDKANNLRIIMESLGIKYSQFQACPRISYGQA
ncbi:hypothetical protein Bca4012_063424 [Brassica carinata]